MRLLEACISQRGLYAHNLDAAQAQALADDMRAIIAEHREVWLARNRPGGLPDSVARFRGGAGRLPAGVSAATNEGRRTKEESEPESLALLVLYATAACL